MHVANWLPMMYWRYVVYIWYISGICNELSLYLCEYVLEEIYVFKLDLKCLKLKFEVGICEIYNQVL